MSLNRAHLAVYQQAGSGNAPGDSRYGAKHRRISRGFVDVNKGEFVIRYWPLKSCCAKTGLTQMTLRNWIRTRVLSATKLYRMHTFCKPEMEAIRKVCDKHREGTQRFSNLTQEFLDDLNSAIQTVRYTLDKKARGMLLNDEEQKLIKTAGE